MTKPKSKGLYVSHLKKYKQENCQAYKDGFACGILITGIFGLIVWALICI